MNKYAKQKALLEMLVTHKQIESALYLLKDEKICFEFEHEFNITENYLSYTTDIETLFCNAVDTIEEIKNTLQSAIHEMNKINN